MDFGINPLVFLDWNNKHLSRKCTKFRINLRTIKTPQSANLAEINWMPLWSNAPNVTGSPCKLPLTMARLWLAFPVRYLTALMAKSRQDGVETARCCERERWAMFAVRVRAAGVIFSTCLPAVGSQVTTDWHMESDHSTRITVDIIGLHE